MEGESGCVRMISLSDSHTLLVGLQSGHLLEADTNTFGQVEEVGHVECGGLEIITLVTRELVVITMTRDYSPVKETSLVERQFGSEVMEGDDRAVRVSCREELFAARGI